MYEKRTAAVTDRWGKTSIHEAYFANGVAHWRIEHRGGKLEWRVISPATCVECGIAALPEYDLGLQQAAYYDYVDEVLSDYHRKASPPTAEQLHEMRTAFGTGAVVVNAITGRKTRL